MRYDRAPEDEYSFRVDCTLDDFEQTYDLLDAAFKRYLPATVRTFAEKFVTVAAPQRNGEPIEKVGDLDPNLWLALGRDWLKGVRGVPLPLSLESSDGEPSEDQTTSPAS